MPDLGPAAEEGRPVSPGQARHFLVTSDKKVPKETPPGSGAEAGASVPCDARKRQRLRNSVATLLQAVLGEFLTFSVLLGTSHGVVRSCVTKASPHSLRGYEWRVARLTAPQALLQSVAF
jgi:hypothetical protein